MLDTAVAGTSEVSDRNFHCGPGLPAEASLIWLVPLGHSLAPRIWIRDTLILSPLLFSSHPSQPPLTQPPLLCFSTVLSRVWDRNPETFCGLSWEWGGSRSRNQ